VSHGVVPTDACVQVPSKLAGHLALESADGRRQRQREFQCDLHLAVRFALCMYYIYS
jgi:hypothetical protein